MKNLLAMHILGKNPKNQTKVHCGQVLRNVSILLLLLVPVIFKCMSQLLVCIFWGTPWCRILHISLGAAQDVTPATLSHLVLTREGDSVGTEPCLRSWTSRTVLPKPRIPDKGVLLQWYLVHWCCKCVLPNTTKQTEYTCFTSHMHCLHNSSQSLYFHVCSTMIYFI